MARRYEVFSGDKRVLTIADEPGPLMSSALPPPDPDWRPPQHPFVTASAHDPSSESALREALNAASSFDDFVERLEAAGYRVEPA